jgi:hypothetical protein
MKKTAIHSICVVSTALVLGIGCATRTRTVVVREPVPSAPIVVREAPPAPPQEVITTAPSPTHVWVPGYYEWQGKRYVWKQGHWVKRPNYAGTYVQGHWEKQPNGWVWTQGYWR